MTDPTERQRQQEAIRALQQERAAELRAQAEKDAKRAIDGATGQNKAARSRGAYDSAERRRALAAHLVKIGADPELAAIRMLLEVSKPPPEPPPHAAPWRSPASDDATAKRKQMVKDLQKEKEAGKDAPGVGT